MQHLSTSEVRRNSGVPEERKLRERNLEALVLTLPNLDAMGSMLARGVIWDRLSFYVAFGGVFNRQKYGSWFQGEEEFRGTLQDIQEAYNVKQGVASLNPTDPIDFALLERVKASHIYPGPEVRELRDKYLSFLIRSYTLALAQAIVRETLVWGGQVRGRGRELIREHYRSAIRAYFEGDSSAKIENLLEAGELVFLYRESERGGAISSDFTRERYGWDRAISIFHSLNSLSHPLRGQELSRGIRLIDALHNTAHNAGFLLGHMIRNGPGLLTTLRLFSRDANDYYLASPYARSVVSRFSLEWIPRRKGPLYILDLKDFEALVERWERDKDIVVGASPSVLTRVFLWEVALYHNEEGYRFIRDAIMRSPVLRRYVDTEALEILDLYTALRRYNRTRIPSKRLIDFLRSRLERLRATVRLRKGVDVEEADELGRLNLEIRTLGEILSKQEAI